jgi:hypothetical protein
MNIVITNCKVLLTVWATISFPRRAILHWMPYLMAENTRNRLLIRIREYPPSNLGLEVRYFDRLFVVSSVTPGKCLLNCLMPHSLKFIIHQPFERTTQYLGWGTWAPISKPTLHAYVCRIKKGIFLHICINKQSRRAPSFQFPCRIPRAHGSMMTHTWPKYSSKLHQTDTSGILNNNHSLFASSRLVTVA